MIAHASMPARRVGWSLILAATLSLTALPVRAQPPGAYDEAGPGQASGLTVHAPQHYVRQPVTGAIVPLDQVSTVVDISDLDLSTRWGAHEAKARIEDAARDVCDRVEEIYPGDEDIPGGCYGEAVRVGLRDAEYVAGYPIIAWGSR